MMILWGHQVKHDQIESLLQSAKAIVKEAGLLVLSYLDRKHEYVSKKDGSIVTEADVASEKELKEKLGALLPEAFFLAEESGVSGSQDSDYCWVIDPLDGTTNFAHGFPYFGINVALTYKDEPILGVTYNPIADELFYACKDGGAFMNGDKIAVSTQNDLNKSLASLAIPCRTKDCHEFYDITKILQDNIYTIRKLGSASLDMAHVASGRLDAAVLKYVSWWDIAAGIVLIREAGGVISEFNGGSIGPDFSSCLASNGAIHNEIQAFFP